MKALQGLDGGHDLGHAGLVVGAQQGGAVGGDEGLALERGQEGEVRHFHHGAGGGQGDVAAVIVLVQDGLDVLAGGVGRGVHVGDQAQGGPLLAAGGGGQRAVYIAVLVHHGVLHTQGVEFLHQHPGQVELALGGRMGPRRGVGGSVHFDVLQKAFVCAHGKAPFDDGFPCLLGYSILRGFTRACALKGAKSVQSGPAGTKNALSGMREGGTGSVRPS